MARVSILIAMVAAAMIGCGAIDEPPVTSESQTLGEALPVDDSLTAGDEVQLEAAGQGFAIETCNTNTCCLAMDACPVLTEQACQGFCAQRGVPMTGYYCLNAGKPQTLAFCGCCPPEPPPEDKPHR